MIWQKCGSTIRVRLPSKVILYLNQSNNSRTEPRLISFSPSHASYSYDVSRVYPSPCTTTKPLTGPSEASTSSQNQIIRGRVGRPVIDLTNEPDTPPSKSLKRHRDVLSPSPELRKLAKLGPTSVKAEITSENPTPRESLPPRYRSPSLPSEVPSVSSRSVSPEPGPPSPAQYVTLSQEQQEVLNDVLAGQSLFFTGSAGSSGYGSVSCAISYIYCLQVLGSLYFFGKLFCDCVKQRRLLQSLRLREWRASM